MIKFVGSKEVNGKDMPVLGMGLSRANCEKLLAGQPIAFNGRQVGLEVYIFIMAGETEQSMIDELETIGVIHSGIKVHLDKDANNE